MKKLTILTTLLTALVLIPTVQAGYAPQVRNTCTLMVKPYNTNTGAVEIVDNPNTTAKEGAQYINYIGNCTGYLDYVTATANFLGNNQYKVQPPNANSSDTAMKGGSENFRLPITNHQHNYYNDSFQDTKNGQTYYYRSIVKQFEIKIEKDSVSSIEKIACYTPRPSGSTDEYNTSTDSCNRTYSYWGGTKVETINNSDGTRTVRWTFGTNNTGIAYVLGNNPDMNSNLSNQENRKLPFSVDLTTKNVNGSIWSATTTSRVLLSEQQINKNNYPANNSKGCTAQGVNDPNSGWCYLDPPPPTHPPYPGSFTQYVKQAVTTPTGVQNTFYWLPIGSVATIWRKPSTPPAQLGCADLQWDGAFKKPGAMGIYTYDTVNPNALLPGEKAIMKFKTIYENGSGDKRPLEYRWVSFYGDQSRPVWFVNNDGLSNIIEAIESVGPGLQPMLLNSLPGRLLRVAHAAPSTGLELSESAPMVNTGMTSATAAQTAAMIILGNFKDEIASTLSGNPLTDNDNQIFYSGGSEGVTLGVQAFYADGQNISGDGPMVATPDGQRQKANTCHLELVVQPTPVTCIDLDISPKTLEPNTPVTFTVTPKFQPNNKTIPLNYRWSAKKKTSYLPGLEAAGAGQIIGGMTAIPGATDDDDSPTWVGSGIADMVELGTGIGVFGPTCPGGNCFDEEEYVVPVDPVGPIVNPIDENLEELGMAEMLGANVFADVGKTALLQADSMKSSSVTTSAASQVSASDYAKPIGLTHGGFKDAQNSPASAVNPYLETKDNKTWYSGGPSNTLIKVQAEGKDGTVYPACSESLVIPEVPGEKCELLKVKFISGTTEVSKDALEAGQTYRVEIDQANSVNTDGSPITKYSLAAYNPAGVGTLSADPANAANCAAVVNLPVINPNAYIQARGTQGSTPVSCKYLYTPNAGDEITLLADPHDNVTACRVDAAVPDVPTEPICKTLNLTTTPAISGNTINQGQLVALNVNPVDTDDQPRPPVVYSETGNGNFVAATTNAATCPAVPASGTFEADPSCKYSYQAPSDNTAASVTIKVKEDDGVAECSRTFTVPEVPDSKEICLALNLRVNGQYTLSPQILPGQSYALQVSPVTTKGNPITMVSWTESGDGRLVGEPGNPAICPALIDNGTVVTLSVCRYIFASPDNAQNIGFSVRAVPDDGVANCIAAAANYTPPEEDEEPFCLYLDLDYTPEPFNPLTTSQMNATVVMSDGSQYSSQPGGLNHVRFTATNNAGRFSGGFGNTSGSGTADFRTQTDNTNNTRIVNYADGTAQSGINVFLSDTNVRMSAACMRQLRPQPDQDEEGCEEPPVIVEYPGNRYCAEEGVGTDQYCWEIEGRGDLIFTNNSRYATGDCVTLDEDYEEFTLLVEDCNPLYRDICWDRINKNPEDEEPGTPKITKRIGKNSTLVNSLAVHFSTTGEAVPQPVHYKLEYTPGNFEQGDSRTMTARIYDPAFSGTIRGLKIHVDGNQSEPGGTIEFDVPQDFSIVKPSGYDLCSDSSSGIDKCYKIGKAGPENSYMEIRGISSDDPIVIEYNGLLKSGITIEDCREGVWCNEEFKNQSRVDTIEYCEETTDENGNETVLCTTISNNDVPDIESNTVIADVVCQYFLTRASGDVFLEDDLVYGVDVSKCYPFKNISSTVVKPITPIEGQLASTGLEQAEIISISHEICSAGQADFDYLDLTKNQIEALTNLFGSGISKNLSSQICEVGLVPGSDWDKAGIAAAMERNIGKLTRWSGAINPQAEIYDFTTLQQQSPGQVYYYSGNGETVTIGGLQIPEGEGAWTIIVENANLQINGDIEYSIGTPAISADQIASLGVIVLNGNIYIDPEVEKLAGAYFVQRSGSPDNVDYYTKGNVISGSAEAPGQQSQKMLTVNGSIYGNIGPLFENRVAAGDITKDEGAITIRYDQRIIQNPPAGLTDLLGSFSQSQMAR